MKEKLPAITIIMTAAAGTASAQSSVNLFGVVDAGISYYETKSTYYDHRLVPALLPPTIPTTVKTSQTAQSSSGMSTSRLGFRAQEDLGGSLSAGIWLEAPLSNDTGGSSLNFTRRSTVSLSGNFGEIRLGRDYTPTFRGDAAADPFGVVGAGTSIVALVGQQLAVARAAATGGALGPSSSDNYVRTSNSFGYLLPPNLGGVYGQVLYAFPEGIRNDAVPGTPSHRSQYVGGRVGYANGPLDVGVAYGESTVADTPNAKEKIKTFNLSVVYDFKVVKLFGGLSQVKNSSSATRSNPQGSVPLAAMLTEQDKYNGAQFGATIPIGPGSIRLSYGRVRFQDGALTPSSLIHGGGRLGATTDKLALGYVHYLSKRTALYGTFARIRIKDGQNNPSVMGITAGGSPMFVSTAGMGAAAGTGYAPRAAVGYDFGIRHEF